MTVGSPLVCMAHLWCVWLTSGVYHSPLVCMAHLWCVWLNEQVFADGAGQRVTQHRQDSAELLQQQYHNRTALGNAVWRRRAKLSGAGASVAEPEPLLLGRLRSRFFCWSEPGPHFLRRLRLRLHLLGKQKRKALFLCQT